VMPFPSGLTPRRRARGQEAGRGRRARSAWRIHTARRERCKPGGSHPGRPVSTGDA